MKNNSTKKKLIERKKHSENDERLYFDVKHSECYTVELEKMTRDDSDITLTAELKNGASKVIKLRVHGYSSGEFIFLNSTRGFPSKHMTYKVKEFKLPNNEKKKRKKLLFITILKKKKNKFTTK